MTDPDTTYPPLPSDWSPLAVTELGLVLVPETVCAGLAYTGQGLPLSAPVPLGIDLPEDVMGAAAKRRADYVAGRLAAAQALQGLTGHWQVPARGADGAPVWPPMVVGAITHSQGWALAQVAHQGHYRGLGLDMERLLAPEEALRLATKVLTDTERRRLADLPPAEAALLVTLTFSAKESLFKALYPLVQRRFYFRHAQLTEWDRAQGRARLNLCQPLSAYWVAGSEFEVRFRLVSDRLVTCVPIA